MDVRSPKGAVRAVLLSATVLAGCSHFGGQGGPPVEVEGGFSGVLSIEDAEFAAQISVDQTGEHLRLTLVTEAFRAQGTGELDGGALHAGLDYGGECPGRMVLSGHASDGGRQLIGSVRATDCTGSSTGSFRFLRHRR